MRPLLALLALASCVSVPHPDEGWTLLSDRDGIRLWAHGLEDSGLPRIRAQADLEVDPLEVLHVLADVATAPDWVPHMLEARYLDGPSNGVSWSYQRGQAPVPANLIVWDRDAVMRFEFEILEPGGRWRSTFATGEPERVPTPTGVVRLPRMNGYADLERTETGSRLVFEVELDAGGALPESLKVYAVNQMPREMIEAMRKRLEETAGSRPELIERWREEGVNLADVTQERRRP